MSGGPKAVQKIATEDRVLSQIQSLIVPKINFLSALPLSSSIILENITLVTGSNSINHLLSRRLQGWMITRINAAVTIYDTQNSNILPDQTLLLTSSGDCIVNIMVF